MPDKERPAGQRVAGQANAHANVRTLRPAPQDESANDDAAVDVEGFKELLPEGWYEAKYLGHQTAMVFNTAKVFLRFEIVQFGDYQGIEVFRAFRVRRLKSRPGLGGAFTLHAGGELYATLVHLLDVRNRADRPSLKPLRSMLFRIRMRTVTTDYRQRPLALHNRYSTVDEIERGE